MLYERIKVECHSGYKLNEYPVAFEFKDHRWEIVEIIDRWYEGGLDPGRPALYYYKVQTVNGNRFMLRHDPLFNTWHMYAFSGTI